MPLCDTSKTQKKRPFRVAIFMLNLLFFQRFTPLSDKRGSNPRPPAWEASALPTELLSQVFAIEPIPGLEPGTHALRMRCSTN